VDPSCLTSTVQAAAGGVMVIFCDIIAADHVHPFMTTGYPSSNGYFQLDNIPCRKAQIISKWFLEHVHSLHLCTIIK